MPTGRLKWLFLDGVSNNVFRGDALAACSRNRAVGQAVKVWLLRMVDWQQAGPLLKCITCLRLGYALAAGLNP